MAILSHYLKKFNVSDIYLKFFPKEQLLMGYMHTPETETLIFIRIHKKNKTYNVNNNIHLFW